MASKSKKGERAKATKKKWPLLPGMRLVKEGENGEGDVIAMEVSESLLAKMEYARALMGYGPNDDFGPVIKAALRELIAVESGEKEAVDPAEADAALVAHTKTLPIE